MYFVYKIEWSQTDQDTVIVKADNKEAAYKKVKANTVDWMEGEITCLLTRTGSTALG